VVPGGSGPIVGDTGRPIAEVARDSRSTSARWSGVAEDRASAAVTAAAGLSTTGRMTGSGQPPSWCIVKVRRHVAIRVVPSRPHLRDRDHGEASGRHAAAVGSAIAAPSARPRMPPCRRAASRGQGSAGGCAPGSHHGQPRSWPQADPRAATVDRRRSVAGQQVRRQPRRRGRRRNRTQPLDRNSTSASGHRADPRGRHRTDR
jgi:hypothetical protein